MIGATEGPFPEMDHAGVFRIPRWIHLVVPKSKPPMRIDG